MIHLELYGRGIATGAVLMEEKYQTTLYKAFKWRLYLGVYHAVQHGFVSAARNCGGVMVSDERTNICEESDRQHLPAGK